MEHHTRTINGIRLHWTEAGTGQPVVLLHGFPEFWYSWRHQLETLPLAGFRAIAPDLRGYNESEQPPGLLNYRVNLLVEDVARLIEQIAGGSALVVGHDWGGIIAWRLAATRPELVRKLAILNAPHPSAYRRTLATNPMQWLRSWYAFFFQLPWLPESTVRAGDFALLKRGFRRQPVNPEAFTPEDIARYKAVFREHGLTGPINYYRAAFWRPGDLTRPPTIVRAPTLVIWGEQDPFLSIQLTENLDRWAPDVRVERLFNASHWVQNDAADVVNQLLIEFFEP